MKKTKITVILLAFSILIVGCNQKKIKKALKYVKVEKITQTNNGDSYKFTGSIVPKTKTYLSFKVAGNINNIFANIGDHVTKGKLLATLESKDYQLKVESAIANLKQAQAKEINAKQQLIRMQKLYANGDISKSSLESVTADYEFAKEFVSSIQKKIDLLNSQLSYTKLYAPFTGTISVKLGNLNENIAPGTPIFMFTDKKHYMFQISVPSTIIYKLKLGQKVNISLSDFDTQSYRGVIKNIGNVPTGVGNTYVVKIKLLQNIPNVRIGMVGTTTLNINSSNKNQIIVPLPSVVKIGNKTYVYIIEKQKNVIFVKQKEIKIGKITSNGIIVKSGLESKMNIVTAGSSNLKDGEQVKIFDEEKGD